MQLQIKNKWISLRGSSIVHDMEDKDYLKVKGKFFTFTAKKFINNLNDETLYIVRNKFWSLFGRKAFIMDKDGNIITTVRRKIFSLHDRYFIESSRGAMEIKGNILQFDYHITVDGREIGHIARRISLRDSFVLDIPDDEDAAYFVALVIAIDNITDRKDRNTSSMMDSSVN